jgi:hypothetical protein
LLTGNLVFEEKGATAMLLAHLQKIPVPLSQRTELAVPACLDRAIMTCLAKEPAKRPASADALGHQLENCDGIGSWSAEDAERWWNTHKVADVGGKPSTERMQVDPDALTTM